MAIRSSEIPTDLDSAVLRGASETASAVSDSGCASATCQHIMGAIDGLVAFGVGAGNASQYRSQHPGRSVQEGSAFPAAARWRSS
jgi:hypothetical protein